MTDRDYAIKSMKEITFQMASHAQDYLEVTIEMRNPVRLFYPIKIKKEVHKTGSLFCGYWKRDIWK